MRMLRQSMVPSRALTSARVETPEPCARPAWASHEKSDPQAWIPRSRAKLGYRQAGSVQVRWAWLIFEKVMVRDPVDSERARERLKTSEIDTSSSRTVRPKPPGPRPQ